MAEYDLMIAEKGEERTNVIQISFSGVSVMWDLDEHKEVTFLAKPNEFNSSSNYVATGFVPSLFDNPKDPKMSNAVFFT